MRENFTHNGIKSFQKTIKAFKSMKFFILFLNLLFIFQITSYANDYSIDSYNGQTITTCNGYFFDSGDGDNNYSDGEDFTVTFKSANSLPIKLEFTEWGVEDHNTCGYDYLSIYDGMDNSANLIGTYCTESPAIVQSSNSNNALHFVWHSDEGYTEFGWEAIISCSSVSNNYSIDEYNGQTITTCNGYFFDSGDGDNNYSDSEDYAVTFKSANSDPIKIDFTEWNVENHNNCGYDYLSIYDGLSTSATLIGTYCNESPYTVQSTNPNNALHIVWHSDGGYTESGWEANVLCSSEPVVPRAKLESVVVGSCINQPLVDVATLDVTLSWNNPTTNQILVNIAGKDEVVDIAGQTQPLTIQFMIEADGSVDNYISSRFSDGAGLVSDLYNAPIACSNDKILCDILYLVGPDKPSDGDAWDNGMIEYFQANSTGNLTTAFTVPVGFGYGLYDPNNTSGNPLNINLEDYQLIVISSTTQGAVANDLLNNLKASDASIINFNFLIQDDLGLTASNGSYHFQDYAYTDNSNLITLYNFENDENPIFSKLVTTGNYYNNAAVSLWANSGDAVNNQNAVIYTYSESDNLPGVDSHGKRVHLGYHPNGFYANQSNGGNYPTPQSSWFNPVKHLTLEAKQYFDEAIVYASTSCNLPITSCPTTFLNNPDFEYDLTSWWVNGNVSVTNDAFSGTKAAKVQTGSGGFGQSFSSVPGTTYNVQAYIKNSSVDVTSVFQLKFFDENNNLISYESVNVVDIEYTLYSIAATAPINAAFVEAMIWKNEIGSTNADAFCLSTLNPIINIENTVVSNCQNHPLVDVATIDVTISWGDAASNFIVVTLGNKEELIDISNKTSPITEQFVVEANGVQNNIVTANFLGNTNVISSSFYNAPNSCSNDQITCDVLYVRGSNKQQDGEPFDLGFANYLDNVNGVSNVTVAFAKSDATGYGLYNSNNINTALTIDLNDYGMVVLSPSTNFILASDLVDDLKSYTGGVLNLNRAVVDELGMATGDAWVNYQNEAFIDDHSNIGIYNYDNINQTYDNIVSIASYHNSNADAYLWDSEWNASAGINGIMFNYESTDALPDIASHGSRTYLGYFMEGIYSNQENGGALPAPISAWFNPVTHLTLEGKEYFDQAILLASQGCTACPEPIVSGIDAPATSCATEEILFVANPAVDGATYLWTFSDDASLSTSTDPSVIIEWATPGVKNVTLTVTKDGCEETYTEVINITEEVFANAGPDRTICRGASTILGATPSGNAAATYLWTPNLFLNDNTVANPVATPPVTTTYTLHVTQNGCTETAEVTVVVDVSLNPTIEAGFDATICDTINEPVELGSAANPDIISYQWSTQNGDINGATSSYYTVQAKTTTMYYVIGYNSSGCYSIDSVKITVIPCVEICNNGIDDDGDGQIDCEDGDCDYVPGCIPDNFHADPTITAQRYDRWTFGDEVDIEFNGGLPETDPNGARIATSQSSTTFTGPNGNLLFYSDGENIYNRNNDVMEGGDEIGGSHGVINSTISFQDPKKDDRMYLFATANDNDQGGNPLTTTATYNYINIHANGGLGTVISKTQSISGTSEGLTAIPHLNGRDVWVITADKNSSIMYSTLVNQQGVQASTAYNIPLGNGTGFPKEINIIGNGQHDMLAVGCYFDEALILYDFNNETGEISNKKEILINERVYGLEFSPNGQFLYVSSYGDQSLFQLQINDTPAPEWRGANTNNERSALNEAQILASRIDISTGLGNYGHLQIGPDGRIYCPVAGVSLGAIFNPNVAGVQSGWDASILDIPGANITGALPNFMYGGCFRTSFLLPVELSFFDVAADGNNAILDWETASELNNDYFLIQRSEDAYSWENIGEVDGNGTTISSVSYNYVDYNLAPGTYFYRLMQVDFDGIYDYSEVKSVEIFESTTFKSMSISPNPVSAGSAINIAGGSNEVFQIIIMSFNGQAIFESVTNSRSVSIADLNLTPGVYMVEITDGNKTYTEKLVVQ